MKPEDQVAHFIEAMRTDPDLATLAVMVDPYLQLMGDKSGVVALLDRMAEFWARARGGRFEIEVAA